MPYDSIVISSGHGKYVRGASGILDEVNEARKVTEQLAKELRARGVEVRTFHDNTSTSQNENLNTIVNFHNAQTRQLDISVHFNAYEQVSKPMGTEVLFVTQYELADELSAAIAAVGFIDRGPKERGDLFFLNNTEMPAVLLEVCFVDSEADADIYRANFNAICTNLANHLSGEGVEGRPPWRPERPPITPPPEGEEPWSVTGKVSHFGGPDDTGVSPSEGLAFIYEVDDAPQLFLPYQPSGTTGLARRLNPHVHYVACRWDYDKVSKADLLNDVALVIATHSGLGLTAFPADWGPNENTGRVADISPSLMQDLSLTTDDEVQVIYPYRVG